MKTTYGSLSAIRIRGLPSSSTNAESPSWGGRVHGAHTLWYFPWEAFIIEGLKNSPE
jgi:hypothetical protein